MQSNVTAQIRSLEEELGTSLFDRLAKRVVLTDAGRRFQPYADKVLAMLEEARCAMTRDSVPAGPITTYVVWHKDKWISPAMSAFVSLLEKRIRGKAHAPSRSRRAAAAS